MISFTDKPKFDQQATVVLYTKEQVDKKACHLSSKSFCETLFAAVKASQFEGAKGDMFPAVVDGRVVILVGLGKNAEISGTHLRIALRRALLAAPLRKIASVEVILHEDSSDNVRAAVDAIIIGAYAWRKYISPRKEEGTIYEKKVILVTRFAKDGERFALVAKAANFARDLVNDNADIVTPEFLANTVKTLVKGHTNVTLSILGRKELLARNLGLVLAVNQGSNKKPRVVFVKYNGGDKSAPYTAFVGKGVTFDSGGLNLKPTGSMETMREDMSGAAAVIGTLKAVLELKPAKNLIFAFGAVENAIGAEAYKPGDVVVGFAGKTVEIGNTDAEGRLVLGDVLSYLIATYAPARIIDLATLTGACRVALGHDHAGLLGNDESLIKDILQSAKVTDDRAWQLPLYTEIRDAMKSKIADIKNTSNLRGGAGTITGAEFIRFFVGDTPWAHLDIAGVAFVEGDSHWYHGHGATGYGVRLLMHFITA